MEAIKEHQKLIRQRSGHCFWDANIIDSHKLCKNENDHKLFYLYLTTPPELFNPNAVDLDSVKTLGEQMDKANFETGIQDLPPELTQDILQNGNEIVIHTRHKDAPSRIFPENPADDEKCPTPDVEVDETLAPN